MDDFEIEGADGSSLEDVADASDDDPLNFICRENLEVSSNGGLKLCTKCEQRVYLILRHVEPLPRRQEGIRRVGVRSTASALYSSGLRSSGTLYLNCGSGQGDNGSEAKPFPMRPIP